MVFSQRSAWTLDYSLAVQTQERLNLGVQLGLLCSRMETQVERPLVAASSHFWVYRLGLLMIQVDYPSEPSASHELVEAALDAASDYLRTLNHTPYQPKPADRNQTFVGVVAQKRT